MLPNIGLKLGSLKRFHIFIPSPIISKYPQCHMSTSLSDDGDATKQEPINRYTLRTHTCGQLSKKDIGKRVNLFGWIQYTRFNNKIIALKDSYGVTQCIVDKSQLNSSFRKTNLYNESVVQVSGVVRARPEGQENEALTTGDIEILADQVEVLNSAKKNLPILDRDDHNINSPTTTNRLKYRYLDLRNSQIQHALRFRSEVCRILRNNLYNLNFVECETPTLYCRTPGGANEFIVPTQSPGQFYSLVQSPQQLKQLLMIGGLDRYFQICRCYRDETSRPDRQPEFTQVDIEMSFTSQEMIMKLIEEMMYNLLSEICDDPQLKGDLLSSFDHDESPGLRRISFREAFDRYGTDKPDTRFEWTIKPHEEGGLYIKIPYSLSETILQEIMPKVKASLGPNRPSPDIECRSGESCTTLVIMDETDEARKLLGAARILIANKLHSEGKQVFRNRFSLLWVTDFPLFTIDEDGKLAPNHHPFTAPTRDSIHLLKEDPLKVVGQHYDLVLNGQEVAGGSIRIHDAELQRQIFTDLLKVDGTTFGYFLEALSSGCPPHGGIAIGLDRLVAILMNRSSIKDVMAFPKASSGRDLMTDSPHELSSEVKKLYHI